MDAIEGLSLQGWRNSSATGPQPKRAIIFLNVSPACLHNDFIACEVEPISGLTRADVIAAANEKNIQIFPIFGRQGSFYRDGQEALWEDIAAQTGGTLRNLPEPLTWGGYPQVVGEVLAELAEQ
jgi:hypothetical protein